METWEQDTILSTINERIRVCKIVSFDVFDTILFRACNHYTDVFEMVGRAIKKDDPAFPLAPVAYKNLRVAAEQRAKKEYKKRTGSYEISFEDIFDQMPTLAAYVDRLSQLELFYEEQVQYLNPHICSLIRHCTQQGKTVVLLSNMYHNRVQIESFLTKAGLDCDDIKQIYVSSEYRASKTAGELFCQLINDYPEVNPEEMLHIGDDINTDIAGAAAVGLQTCHYSVVPENAGSIYDYEHTVYQVDLGELRSLRKLASANVADRSVNTFYQKLGAEVLGPLYAAFADYVIQQACCHDIEIILPIMREGELLSRLITRALVHQKIGIICNPLYLSRIPAFTASLCEENLQKSIRQMLLRGGANVCTLFEQFCIDIIQTPYKHLAHKTLSSLGDTLKAEIEQFFLTSHNKEQILENAQNQRQLLLQYLLDLTDGKRALIVNLGIKGSTETLLHTIVRNTSLEGTLRYLLLMGSSSCVEHLLDGVNIEGWLGLGGENGDDIDAIMPHVPVLETLLNAHCGTVLKYVQEKNKVNWILKQTDFPKVQADQIDACWNGIECFQTYWFLLMQKKPFIKEKILQAKKSYLGLCRRLIEMPTQSEAQYIGRLYYLDDLHFSTAQPLGKRTLPRGLTDKQLESHIHSTVQGGSYWPQAEIAMQYPAFFKRQYLRRLSGTSANSVIVGIINRILELGVDRIVIFGAAELGRALCHHTAFFGISTTCFVDSNPSLHGRRIKGIPIVPLAQVPDDTQVFVIASLLYADEIEKAILEHIKMRSAAVHVLNPHNF